jgi:2'-5' RNA ligase
VNRIEDLFANVAAGRGFWAGLFPTSWRGDNPPPIIEGDAHCTLVHFGRKVSSQVVERVITACQRAIDPPYGEIEARGWGIARMDQSKASVVALLLEGERLDAFHRTLLGHCHELGIRVDDQFAFHPHMTLHRLELDDPAKIGSAPSRAVRFQALSLVCGEARVDFDLGPSPF